MDKLKLKTAINTVTGNRTINDGGFSSKKSRAILFMIFILKLKLKLKYQ